MNALMIHALMIHALMIHALMIHALMIHALPTLLLGFLIKSTLLLLAAWAAGCLLRRASAATRHLIWSVALGGVLLLPALSLSLPRWNVAWSHVSAATPPAPIAAPQPLPLPLAPADAPAVSQAAPSSVPASKEAENPPVVAPVPRIVPIPRAGRRFWTFTRLLGVGLFVWLIGLLSVLCRLAVGLSRLARIAHHSIPLKHGEFQMAEDVRGAIGLRRPVRFLRASESCGIAVPVTWGAVRPVVLLPTQSSVWSDDCLRAALLHEMAHVLRWDWATQLMARLACALCWWHPLIWWAARQAREESERACDDLVLGMGMKAADYAQRLVEVVRSMPAGTSSPTVAIAMSQPSELEGRLHAVLDGKKNRGGAGRGQTVFVFLTALVLALPLAALRLRAQTAVSGRVDAGVTVRESEGATQYIGPASYKAVYPNGLVFEMVRHGADPALTASGYRATLPNGYTAEVLGVAREVNRNGKWAFTRGPWWGPDGKPLPRPPIQQDLQWRKGPISVTDGAAPTYVATHITPPAGLPITGDTSDPSWFGIDEELIGPISRAWPWSYNLPSTNVKTSSLDAVFTKDAHTCTLRCAIAAGPWNTVATLPFRLTPHSVRRTATRPIQFSEDARVKLDDRPALIYQDAAGRLQVDYFLGRDGLLGHVARRVVAVYTSGQTVVPQQTATGVFGTPIVSLAFPGGSPASQYGTNIDLSRVKEFHLQTRPFQTVEFRGIHLQPSGPPSLRYAATSPPRSASRSSVVEIKTLNPRQVTVAASHVTQVSGGATMLGGRVRIVLGNAKPSAAGHGGRPLAVRRTRAGILIRSGKPRTQMEIPFRPDGSVSYSPKSRTLTFTDTAGVALTITGASYTFADDVRHTTTIIDGDSQANTIEGGQAPAVPAAPAVGSTGLNFQGHPVIVVDPGHGGQDTGAVGAGRVPEKSLSLEIAQHLRAELERRGAVVFLTRDGDTYPPSTERVRFAAQRRADYFVSLHCDVWTAKPSQVRQYQNARATGTFVYYHGQDPKEHRLAHSISLMIGQATDLTPNTVASDTTRFLTGFYVLREAHMPAVLVECGYINNPQELARLRDPREQQRLAQGIAAGLAAFQIQD